MTAAAMAEGVECSRAHLARIESGNRPLTRGMSRRVALAVTNHLNRPNA